MTTEFGKVLRIIRINTGDSARIMSQKLGISAAYLSAIEMGKRNVPQEMEAVLFSAYSIPAEEKDRIRKSIVNSCEQVKIDLTELAEKKKQVLYALKDDMDEDTLDKLCQIISEKNFREDL